MRYVKYSKSTEELREYNEKNNPDLTRRTVNLINSLTNSRYEFDEGKGTLNMCEAFEGIKREGLNEGLRQGKAEGLRNGEYRVIVRAAEGMERRGMTYPEIASMLGISEMKLAEAYEYMDGLKSGKAAEKDADMLMER